MYPYIVKKHEETDRETKVILVKGIFKYLYRNDILIARHNGGKKESFFLTQDCIIINDAVYYRE